MKTFWAFVLFLIIPSSAMAADLYVSTSGSGSTCSVGSPCALSYANSNATAGDNVYLLAGTYNSNGERINPSNSGTSGNPITFQSSGGTVTITGSACDGGESEAAVELDNVDYIVIDGIDATDCGRFLWVHDSDYNEIANCSFDDSDDSAWPSSRLRNSDYNWIHDTQFSKCGSADYGGSDHGSCLDIGNESNASHDSNYNLIEDCTFFHGGHHVAHLLRHQLALFWDDPTSL